MAVVLTGSSLVQPAGAEPTKAPVADSVATTTLPRPHYSDREVLAWLLAAAGPIAEQHPDSLRYLGLTEQTRPPVHWSALNAAITDYLRYDKSFHQSVAVPMQSGDPIRTEQAFKVFSAHAKTYMALS